MKRLKKYVDVSLVKRKTEDGLMEMRGDVRIGKHYKIDLYSIKEQEFFNTEYNIYHKKITVEDANSGGVLPVELLTSIELDAFVEGYKKGYKKGREDAITT